MPSPNDPVPFQLPPDFAERCHDTRRGIEAGEPTTFQQLADALGLPFEFVAAAVAIAAALASGQPVVVDPASIRFDA